MYVRRYLITHYVMTPSQMNVRARSLVRASAQGHIILSLKETLSDEEWAIVRRARNQKNLKVPKNASLSEYRYATGFEALIGFLHLMHRQERMEEIIIKGIQLIDEKRT